MTDLKNNCQAVEIGRLGEMRLFVSMRPHVKWPRGSLGVVLQTNPFKIFSPTLSWIVDPLFENPKKLTFSEDDQARTLSHHKEVAFIMERDIIKDPLDAYLFMGNLLLSGFRPHNPGNWASYFINNVGSMLYDEKVFPKLVM